MSPPGARREGGTVGGWFGAGRYETVTKGARPGRSSLAGAGIR